MSGAPRVEEDRAEHSGNQRRGAQDLWGSPRSRRSRPRRLCPPPRPCRAVALSASRLFGSRGLIGEVNEHVPINRSRHRRLPERDLRGTRPSRPRALRRLEGTRAGRAGLVTGNRGRNLPARARVLVILRAPAARRSRVELHFARSDPVVMLLLLIPSIPGMHGDPVLRFARRPHHPGRDRPVVLYVVVTWISYAATAKRICGRNPSGRGLRTLCGALGALAAATYATALIRRGARRARSRLPLTPQA